MDQGQGQDGPGVHPAARPGRSARACTPSARRPAAPTSTNAGRTGRRPSSSAATSARGAATSARSTPASRPSSTRDEPRRVAESVATMGLRYATVTGVARDDLPDGGAWLYAETVRQIHALVPGCGVELLIPDFNGDPDQLGEVFAARPEVLAHNVETVPRIFKRIRPGVPLRALAGRAHPGARGRAGDQVEPDPRPGRGAARRSPRRCATCTTRAASCSRSRSTCARARATTRSSAG